MLLRTARGLVPAVGTLMLPTRTVKTQITAILSTCARCVTLATSKLFFAAEQVSNDTYLRIFGPYMSNATSKFGNASTMNNHVKLSLSNENYNFTSGFNVYENLNGSKIVSISPLEMKVINKQGKIINMASQAGRRGEALVAHYCATKAAVISYTQSAALALADYGIQVNAISPGVVDTPMWNQVDALFAKYQNLSIGEKKRLVAKEIPLGRIGTPSDIAYMALFLASGLSDYITGQTYNVDGGSVLN